MLLENKSAIITGGANGIGFATAEELLKSGVSRILVLDLGACFDLEKKTCLQKSNPCASIFYAQCDVTNKAQVEEILRGNAIQWLKKVDVFVNSAGILTEADPARCIATNLTGLIDCTLIAMDLMTKDNGGDGGCIVNISSIAGLEPHPFAAAYAATKFGVVGFTRSLGTELLFNQTGVKLIAICPGATDTNIYRNIHTSNCTFSWMKPHFKEFIETMIPQTSSVVGQSVVKAIIEGETGSVWICNEDQITSVSFEASQIIKT